MGLADNGETDSSSEASNFGCGSQSFVPADDVQARMSRPRPGGDAVFASAAANIGS